MNESEEAALADPSQHAQRCPGCLSRNTRQVPGVTPGEQFMGCDQCGHTWVGKDFELNEQEHGQPIPVTS